jgi:ribonuclease HII
MDLKKEKELIDFGYKNICGIDEVGRGPLAGPIVICCFLLDIEKSFNEVFIKIDQIKDSKKISDKKRRELFKNISNTSLEFSFGCASNIEIDKYGIIEANRLAIERGVNGLKNKPDYILFDYNTCDIDFLKTPFEKIIKGDDKIFSIACSSILAKVYRDDLMIELSKTYSEYDLDNNSGYGTSKHIKAIEKFGITEIHRKSFCKKFIK